jgi:nitrite reductase/ring-hydroxylating ferredoxin subunit
VLNRIVAVEVCDPASCAGQVITMLNRRPAVWFIIKIKMQRKDFIKSTCNFCLLGAAGLLLPDLIGCSPAIPVFKTTVINNNQIQIPLTIFDRSPIQFIRPKGWYYDIAIQKKEDSTYSAILLKCTHQDNQLIAVGNGFSCSQHGSQFDKTGKVKKGPAEKPLREYTTVINQGLLIITV